MSSPEHYDIAVVGGGIAGLYCCLRAPRGTRIALFEATGRIGGRLETSLTGGFQAEWGSMRFDPERQHTMGKLIKELGLETEPFPEYNSPPVDERMARYGFRKDERGLNALELYTLGIARVLNKPETGLLETSEEELEHLRRRGTHRNGYLWEQGVWHALADVLSYDAVKYIMTDGSFFHGIHENPGVAGSMITWVKMLQMSKFLKGVKGGMQSIAASMLQRVTDRGVMVRKKHSLQGLAPLRGNAVTLSFNTGEFTADHVILAMPSSALKALRGIPEDMRALLDSVIEIPLLKCFFVVKDPWWQENIPNSGVQNFPARELHYYKQDTKGMVMVYADRPGVNFWTQHVASRSHDRAETGCNQHLPMLFAERMNIDPASITAYGIRDWTRPPYGAGVHLWKPGIEFWKVSEALEAFPLLEGSPRNVHICGEAFSDYQGFMEGAVRSADRALTKALN